MYTSEAPRNTMARNPSHVGSNRELPAGGSASSSLASIGSIGGAMGKSFLARRDVVIQMKYTAGIRGSAGARSRGRRPAMVGDETVGTTVGTTAPGYRVMF